MEVGKYINNLEGGDFGGRRPLQNWLHSGVNPNPDVDLRSLF